jgi:organic radical activating enzyme
MNYLNRIIDRFFTPVKPLPAGMYHFQAPADAAIPYRLHLRIEQNGEGILVVNAKTVLHLNQTATEHIYHMIQNSQNEDAVNQISRRYRVNKETARLDFQQITDRIKELVATPDLDPVTFLDFERRDPHTTDLSAPLRLDCALTYQTSDSSGKGVAPVERVQRELLDEEWKKILDKAWEAGIPHIIFTGGEPTLRPDLPDLIAHSEKLGQVAGLITDGYRLTDSHYFHTLLQSGLDHLMIVLNPTEEQSWEAVRDAVMEDIFTTVHLTITAEDAQVTIPLLERLAKMGVTSISLSVNEADLNQTLQEIRKAAADRGLSLIWDLPVPYSRLNPVALEFVEGEDHPSGAGMAWLYVEPDGDVVHTQGDTEVLGNLLNDPWDKIWKKN